MLEWILPLFGLSEEDSNSFALLKGLYEGINMIDQYYYRRDETQPMMGKCLWMLDHQAIQIAAVVMYFVEIIKPTNLNKLQLKTDDILTYWEKIFQQTKDWNSLKWTQDEGVSVP